MKTESRPAARANERRTRRRKGRRRSALKGLGRDYLGGAWHNMRELDYESRSGRKGMELTSRDLRAVAAAQRGEEGCWPCERKEKAKATGPER